MVKMNKKTKIILGIGAAVLIAGVAYYYYTKKSSPVKAALKKYPSLVTTKAGTFVRAEPNGSVIIDKYENDGIELMVTDTKVVDSGKVWYNILDYSNGMEGWVSADSVNFKV